MSKLNTLIVVIPDSVCQSKLMEGAFLVCSVSVNELRLPTANMYASIKKA